MVYLLYSFFFFLLGFFIFSKEKQRREDFLFYFFAIVLFWGVSYYDAVDTPGYIFKYDYEIQSFPGRIDRQFEIGYTLLAMLFKTLNLDYWVFQFVVFTAEVWLIIKGLKKFFDDRTLAFILPLLFFLYARNLAAFRQGIAISIFIFGLHFIYEKDFKYSLLYFVCIFIASLFHQSALFLSIVYLSRFLNRILSKDWLLFFVLIVGDLIWATGGNLVSQLDFLLPFFRGDILDMGQKYANMIESDSLETFGFAKIVEVNMTVFIYTLFCKNDKNYELFRFNMMLYAIIGLVLGGILAHRLNYYWMLLYYVCFMRGVMAFSKRYGLSWLGYFVTAVYLLWFFVFKSGFINREYTFLFNY